MSRTKTLALAGVGIARIGVLVVDTTRAQTKAPGFMAAPESIGDDPGICERERHGLGHSCYCGAVAWMKAMIPHHSIAILTSERAQISDPRARKLADEIVDAQRREISKMEGFIADLEPP